MSITSKWFDDYERRKRGEPAAKKPDAGGRQDGGAVEIHDPIAEQTIRAQSLGKGKGKKSRRCRFRVSILSRRSRLLDPDNLAGKCILDNFRYAGIIEQDDADSIEYSISQEKVPKGCEETIITVEPIE